MGVVVQHHSPAALPPGETRYPLYRRLGGPQCRYGQVRKISPPPEFDPRTVQPVASRYTDYAIPAARLWDNVEKYCGSGQTTDDSMAYALGMLDNLGDKNALSLCST